MAHPILYGGAPVCTADDRCEISIQSLAFGRPSENEMRVAAKLYGQQRGEEGWTYMPKERPTRVGWIVVRRLGPRYLRRNEE